MNEVYVRKLIGYTCEVLKSYKHTCIHSRLRKDRDFPGDSGSHRNGAEQMSAVNAKAKAKIQNGKSLKFDKSSFETERLN